MFKIMTDDREMIVRGDMAAELFDACVDFVQKEYKKLSLGGEQMKGMSVSENMTKKKVGRPKVVKTEPVLDSSDTEGSP